MIDISIDIRGTEIVKQAARALGKNVNDPRTVRRIVQPGVAPIRDGIRAVTPVGTKEHYSYRKKRRIAKFVPGHLRKSTQDISQRKRGYKRVPVIYIGPVFTRKAGQGGTFGQNVRAVDAYYAHMVFGSALAYEKRVIEAGFRGAKAAAEVAIVANATKIIEKEGQKAGFSR